MKITFDVVEPSKNGIGFGMQYSPRISVTFDDNIAWTWTDSEEFDYFKDAKESSLTSHIPKSFFLTNSINTSRWLALNSLERSFISLK